jgi:hypothetical protein
MNRRLQEPTGAGHGRNGSEVGALDRRRGSLWCQMSNRLMGAHAVGLIEHHQIPLRGLLQPGLEIIVPRELPIRAISRVRSAKGLPRPVALIRWRVSSSNCSSNFL